jgi:hypothetical protein
MNASRPSSDRDRDAAGAEQYRRRQAEEPLEALHAVEADDEEARAEAATEPSADGDPDDGPGDDLSDRRDAAGPEDQLAGLVVPLDETEAEVVMVPEKVRAWGVLQAHPIAKTLDSETQLALLCEYIDLREDLQGMSLADFIVAALAPDAGELEPGPEVVNADPGDGGDAAPDEVQAHPASLVGLRVVYRFPGRNVLSNGDGVTRDSGGAVAFVDVDGEFWSNVTRDEVYPIDPANFREIHVTRREAEEIEGWLAGEPSPSQPEGDVLRNLTVEFPNHPEKIVLAVVNGQRPYVDRFVQLPGKNFEDDQKPTTRLFGEHCFRVRGKDYVVNVLCP